MVYDTRICLDCGKERLVRRWSNKTGLCRSCSAKRCKPLTLLPEGFIRGEQIGRAAQTIYFKQECSQCHIPRWMRANLQGAVTPNRLCPRCAGLSVRQSKRRQGKNNGHWRGGRCSAGGGYIKIYSPDHPRADKKHYVREHILVWEQANGRLLPDGWVVHHLDGVRDNNQSSNLLGMPKGKHSASILLREVQKILRQCQQTIIDENCIVEKKVED